MNRLRIFLPPAPPLDGMLVHRRVTPIIKFAGTHLYTWVERGTLRVKCLAQEHNTMSPARARTRSACSACERTNHEATAPLIFFNGWRVMDLALGLPLYLKGHASAQFKTLETPDEMNYLLRSYTTSPQRLVSSA